MPLIKSITLPTHVEVTYWKISKIILEIEARKLYINAGGFISKEAYQAGALPAHEFQVVYEGEPLNEALANVTNLLPNILSLITTLEPMALAKLPQLEGGTPTT